jgi:hypothetical protein
MNNKKTTTAAKKIAGMIGIQSFEVAISWENESFNVLVDKTIPLARRIALIEKLAGTCFQGGAYLPGIFESYAIILIIDQYTDIDVTSLGIEELFALNSVTGLYSSIISDERCDAGSVVSSAWELVDFKREKELKTAAFAGIGDSVISLIENLNAKVNDFGNLDATALFSLAKTFSGMNEDKIVEAVVKGKETTGETE